MVREAVDEQVAKDLTHGGAWDPEVPGVIEKNTYYTMKLLSIENSTGLWQRGPSSRRMSSTVSSADQRYNYVCTYIYIYIYIDREREREIRIYTHMYVCQYIYIYIYTLICVYM